MARRSQSVVDIRTRNPLLQPSPLVHELATMAILAGLGIIAARLNVQIPHTQVFIDGRWVFGYMGFVLLRRWPLAILPACILSLATFKDLSPWFALTANLSYAIPSFLLIRAAHDRVLSRLSSLLWYGLGWAAVVGLCYQLFNTPMVWGFRWILDGESFLQGALRGWLIQPFLLESVLVAMMSGSVLVALRSHAEMSRSREQLATTLDSIGDAVVSTDADGCITRMNPVARELTGWSLDEAVGRPFDEVIRLEDSQTGEPLNSPVAEVLDRDHAVEMSNTTTLIAHDGTRRHIADNASPLHSSSGQLVGVVMVFRDVTEQKQRRDAFARFCDMSADMICLADINTATFLQINPAATEILGYSEEELLSQPFTNFVHPDDLEATRRIIEEQLKRGQKVVSFENRYFRKNGDICWLHWNSHPIAEEGLTYAIAHDITDRKREEQERRNLESQLLQAQKMEAVGRLAGGVAHDFNNKLQTILGYSDILLHEEHLPRSLREYINEISQAARQSADLTRQLLAFARKQTIVPQVLDLNQMIPDMLRMLKPLISEEIDLQWLPGDHVGPVRMDPAQVDQILANLVVNARDAIEQNGTITVETASADIDAEYVRQNAYARAGKHAVLIVTDDGAGMDAQTLEQVFEPFFTTKPQNQGTGLGLATVYGIVKQNGGFVNVYSEPDKGTTFRIYLPQSDGEEPAAPTETRTAMLQTGSETILLVEDDPAILRLGQETLEKLGYTVLAAERPSTALEMIDEGHEIDLLVTDVVMPEMNGKNLLEQLTQHRPGLHALFMSGYTANVIAHRGVLDDGVEFLQKPFRAMDLAWSVRRILDQGRTANAADTPPEMS